MDDMTEARPTATTVTAQEIVEGATARERAAVCDFLMAQAMQMDVAHQNAILLLRDAVKAGAHR